MQLFSAVKPKHIVGIDHEISKRFQKSMPDELYRRRKTFAFRSGQAVAVPLKGTIDFRASKTLGRSAGNYPRTLSDRNGTDQDTPVFPQ